ncbi:30S ribosomal protein S11 [Candidatus Dojkabacteria bacterium]|nr:30S ribosomal protein S11 [Candidatus Dojkabacteria bacterium]
MADKAVDKKTKVSKVVKKDVKPKKNKVKRKVLRGRAYIKATFNNTMITITDEEGATLAWGSPAILGYSGARKGSSFVATKAAEDVATRVQRFGLVEIDVFVSGPGSGRNAAIKGLASGGLRINTLRDVTPIRHGGCKPRKRPRGS